MMEQGDAALNYSLMASCSWGHFQRVPGERVPGELAVVLVGIFLTLAAMSFLN